MSGSRGLTTMAIFGGLVALSIGLAPLARAQDPPVGPLVEIPQPNAVGSCNTGFNLFGTWPLDDAEVPSVAVNPAHPNNIVAAWIQARLAMAAYRVLPSDLLHGVGIPEYLPLARQGIYFTAPYSTCTSPWQRFDAALASGSA